MARVSPAWIALFCGLGVLRAAPSPTAAELSASVQSLTLDPEQTCRVRDVQFSRGDVNFYLTEGILSFIKPVEGRKLAAVFTTTGAEAGDAEVLALPSKRSERASLLAFTKTPNLDEHFDFAMFVFSDATADELIGRIGDFSGCKVPAFATEIEPQIDRAIRPVLSDLDLPLVRTLLNGPDTNSGFFYAAIRGRTLGNFNVLYDPHIPESTTIGAGSGGTGPDGRFQLWTAFRPRKAPVAKSPPSRFGTYVIDAVIADDLGFSATASFDYLVEESGRRAFQFGLSDRLQVDSAEIDGRPAEVFQRKVARPSQAAKPSGAFLVIAADPPKAGAHCQITVKYRGELIFHASEQTYIVEDRNTWYPYFGNMMASFDLRFRSPEALTVISTGELISQTVENGTRLVHRKTSSPQALAGFNVGRYEVTSRDSAPYRVESYANASHPDQGEQVATKTAAILQAFTKRWNPLPLHNIAVSPVPGYFGQGFPGLIYLSDVSYTPQQERPAYLRGARMDSFFSSMLLSHEVAHQWWGNVLSADDYRVNWLIEAMATDSALEYLAETEGKEAADAVLEQYRLDLLFPRGAGTIESAGPVDFGVRLIDAAGLTVWHTITYEKGSWILHMLRDRIGPDGFLALQSYLLKTYRTEPITNEQFREAAARFVPAGQPDRDLRLFFDTWVYSTGIPHIESKTDAQEWSFVVSRVDESFTADLPLSCKDRTGKTETKWVRAVTGENSVSVASGTTCTLPSPRQYLYLR
ncbi:MAG: M1 family metallopeptidase [Bryobacteraceae bacterium]